MAAVGRWVGAVAAAAGFAAGCVLVRVVSLDVPGTVPVAGFSWVLLLAWSAHRVSECLVASESSHTTVSSVFAAWVPGRCGRDDSVLRSGLLIVFFSLFPRLCNFLVAGGLLGSVVDDMTLG